MCSIDPPGCTDILLNIYAERRDLREYNVCSIDPPGCTDIDDALHCKELENGNFEVYAFLFTFSYFELIY